VAQATRRQHDQTTRSPIRELRCAGKAGGDSSLGVYTLPPLPPHAICRTCDALFQKQAPQIFEDFQDDGRGRLHHFYDCEWDWIHTPISLIEQGEGARGGRREQGRLRTVAQRVLGVGVEKWRWRERQRAAMERYGPSGGGGGGGAPREDLRWYQESLQLTSVPLAPTVRSVRAGCRD
jgi:hypothetical protein